MMRSAVVVGVALGVLLAMSEERRASACGGCFQPPPPPNQTTSDVTDERMLFVISTTQSTLYDQLEYTGNPASFAWVLPIRGTVDVGLSADVLFDSFDALTSTQVQAPPYSCPQYSNCGGSFGAAFASNASAPGTSYGGAGAPPPVVVTKQENVGPYDTVQLHSKDTSALEAWLAQNGFVIPTTEQPIIAAYVAEGFDFLAMKLLPNEGVQAMRPVRVTTPGASYSLPLRMASIGTGATVGITIWVVSDGRYEPQNFPFFHIEDSALAWDWSTSSSNYTTLRKSHETALGGKGWEIESSIDLNQQIISNAILSGGTNLNAVSTGASPPSSASDDYLPVGDPDAGADSGAYQSADDVRDADIAALFVGLPSTVRVTRIRSDIAHAAMTQDLVLQASAEQSELSNLRTATISENLVCNPPQNCSSIGCAATLPPRSRGGVLMSLGALAAVLGIFAARLGRARGARKR